MTSDAPLIVDDAAVKQQTARTAGHTLFDDAAVKQQTARTAGHTLSKRALLNSVAAFLDFVARSIIEFLLNPFLVGRLGSYLYGAWRVLIQMTGYLWAASGRSAPALTAVIANRQHSADDAEKRRALASAVVTWLIFLPLLAAIGGVVSWFAPSFLRAPSQHVGAIRTAAALLVADAILLTLVTLPRSVLQGENLGYKRMGLSGGLLLAQGGLMGLAVHLGAGIVGVAAANITGTFVMGLLFWRVARRHVPWFGVERPSRGTVRWFLGLNWWFTAWKFLIEFIRAGDVVVLGLFAPIELVTIYALSRFIPEALIQVLANPLQGLTPGLGGIIGSGDFRRAIRVRNDFMAFTWVTVTAIGATILLWNKSFVTLWVGHQYYPGPLTTLLIVLATFQFILIRNDAWIIDVTLRVATKVLLGLLAAAFSFTLAAALVGILDLGIAGVALGFLAGRFALTIAYPWLVGRALGHGLESQLRSAVRPLLATAAIFGVATALAPRVDTTSWAVLVLAGGGTAVVILAVAAFVGLTSYQRRRLSKRIVRMAKQVGVIVR